MDDTCLRNRSINLKSLIHYLKCDSAGEETHKPPSCSLGTRALRADRWRESFLTAAPTREKVRFTFVTVASEVWHEIFSPLSGTLSGSAYLGVAVGDQSDGHDVLQHGPGGEELLGDEDPAGWTQTLIVQSDGYWRNSLVWSGSVHLHTLLLNLRQENKTVTSVKTCSNIHLQKIRHVKFFQDNKFQFLLKFYCDVQIIHTHIYILYIYEFLDAKLQKKWT